MFFAAVCPLCLAKGSTRECRQTIEPCGPPPWARGAQMGPPEASRGPRPQGSWWGTRGPPAVGAPALRPRWPRRLWGPPFRSEGPPAKAGGPLGPLVGPLWGPCGAFCGALCEDAEQQRNRSSGVRTPRVRCQESSWCGALCMRFGALVYVQQKLQQQGGWGAP